MTAADVGVKEGGKLVAIRQLKKLNRLPLRYCVVFDKSRSQAAEFKFQQDAAAELLQHVLRPNFDHGWLALFDVVSEDSSETADPRLIVNVIRSTVPGGGTALYDAVNQCASRMMRPPRDAMALMFLLSDGNDNQSHVTWEEAAEAALRAGIRVYAIDAAEAPNEQGLAILRKLAERTGGQAFSAVRSKDFNRIAAEIDDDLDNLFLLVLPAQSSKDNRPVKLEVKCGKKGAMILAPREFYPTLP